MFRCINFRLVLQYFLSRLFYLRCGYRFLDAWNHIRLNRIIAVRAFRSINHFHRSKSLPPVRYTAAKIAFDLCWSLLLMQRRVWFCGFSVLLVVKPPTWLFVVVYLSSLRNAAMAMPLDAPWYGLPAFLEIQPARCCCCHCDMLKSATKDLKYLCRPLRVVSARA